MKLSQRIITLKPPNITASRKREKELDEGTNSYSRSYRTGVQNFR